jgi:hypothetical protein
MTTRAKPKVKESQPAPQQPRLPPLEASIIIHPVGCSRPSIISPPTCYHPSIYQIGSPLFVIHPSQQILERWTDRKRYFFSIFKSSAKYIHIYYMYFSKINLPSYSSVASILLSPNFILTV